MKKLLTLFLLATISTVAMAQESWTTTVNGIAPQMEDGSTLTLFNMKSNAVVDTAEVRDGRFTFIIESSEVAPYFVRSAQFFNDGAEVNISIEPGKQYARGTALTETFSAFEAEMNEYSKLIAQKQEEAKNIGKDDSDAYATIMQQVEEYEQQKNSAAQKYYIDNKKTPAGLLTFFMHLKRDNVDFLQAINNYFEEYPDAKDYTFLKVMHGQMQAARDFRNGEMFTDFTVRNIENTADVKLSDYVGKGKYVLLDYWASWCGPCLAEIPNLKAVQEEFGGENFTVLGISVWDTHEATLETLKKSGTTWPHLFDANEKESAAAQAYEIRSIPTIILFAPDGTILAGGLHGGAIRAVVSEHLKSVD